MMSPTKLISISCEKEIEKHNDEKLYTDFKLNYAIIQFTKWMIQIANQEPNNSNDFIFWADGHWLRLNKIDVP